MKLNKFLVLNINHRCVPLLHVCQLFQVEQLMLELNFCLLFRRKKGLLTIRAGTFSSDTGNTGMPILPAQK